MSICKVSRPVRGVIGVANFSRAHMTKNLLFVFHLEPQSNRQYFNGRSRCGRPLQNRLLPAGGGFTRMSNTCGPCAGSSESAAVERDISAASSSAITAVMASSLPTDKRRHAAPGFIRLPKSIRYGWSTATGEPVLHCCIRCGANTSSSGALALPHELGCICYCPDNCCPAPRSHHVRSELHYLMANMLGSSFGVSASQCDQCKPTCLLSIYIGMSALEPIDLHQRCR